MLLIGISGKKLSGKDTACQLLKELAGSASCQRFAFADELKLEVSKALKIPVETINKDKTYYRPLLQWWGNWRREKYSPDYWVMRVFQNILLSSAPICCITDVRYLNEAQAIKEVGGRLIRLSRPSEAGEYDTHQSEIELDDYSHFDAHIKNDTTITALKIQLEQILNRYYAPNTTHNKPS